MYLGSNSFAMLFLPEFMAAMLVVMMTVIVVTGVSGALHPPSNVEVIDPQTLHLKGEFVESNLGTAVEPDGSVTVRLIALQFDFVPGSVRVRRIRR